MVCGVGIFAEGGVGVGGDGVHPREVSWRPWLPSCELPRRLPGLHSAAYAWGGLGREVGTDAASWQKSQRVT